MSPYTVALFLHVSGAIRAFISLGIWLFGLIALRRARLVEQVRAIAWLTSPARLARSLASRAVPPRGVLPEERETKRTGNTAGPSGVCRLVRRPGGRAALSGAPRTFPAPQRWHTATAAREAHPVSTRQT